MLFNSLHFVGFFAFVFGLVWLAIRLGGARVAPRNACILVASYVFYDRVVLPFLSPATRR